MIYSNRTHHCFQLRAPRLILSLTLLAAHLLTSPLPLLAEGKKSAFDSGPKTIASQEHVSVLIDREVADGKSSIILKVSVPTDSKINTFVIPDPQRLVIDFEGASIKKSETFQVPENGVIKQIRLGSHADKLRVVVDLLKSVPPEYDWKAGKRQVIVTFVEGKASTTQAPAPQPTTGPSSPTTAPVVAVTPTKPPEQPTAKPTATPIPPTSTPTTTPTTAAPVKTTSTPTATPSFTPQETLSDVAPKVSPAPASTTAVGAAVPASLPAAGKDAKAEEKEDLGDLQDEDEGPPPTRVPTTFSIKGYKFEYMPDKSPVLKILLNKPRAQAQISKVDAETYKIEIKDCGVDNEDLELPQFPPHDFIGFVMVVSEVVGKNVEVSISVEDEIVIGTSVHENEIWVKKP